MSSRSCLVKRLCGHTDLDGEVAQRAVEALGEVERLHLERLVVEDEADPQRLHDEEHAEQRDEAAEEVRRDDERRPEHERAGGELVVCASACRVPRQRESQKFAATSVIESRRAVIVWCVPYRAR